MLVDIDLARGLQLVDDRLCVLVLGGHPVEQSQLLLDRGESGYLGIEVQLPRPLLLCVGLHLGGGPSSFRAALEHVGGRAFLL